MNTSKSNYKRNRFIPNRSPNRLFRCSKYVLSRRKYKIKDALIKSSVVCSSNIISEISVDDSHNFMDFNYIKYTNHCIVTWMMSTTICFTLDFLLHSLIDDA